MAARWSWLFLWLGLGMYDVAIGAEPAKSVKAIVPQETIQLVGGKDLSKFYVWVQDTGHSDPRGIFKLQPDGILRISGDGFGGLITHEEYANYYLVIEYRWGTETLQRRAGRARDSGLLLHCQGPDGNVGIKDGKPGPWMNSIECQIIEGGVGDILVLRGKDANGEVLEASATVEISHDRNGKPIWTAGGEKTVFSGGRINWYGRDPDWKDVAGFRGPKDVDSPGQEWTTLECYCNDDALTYVVNGTVVNRATEVKPKQGKILLQTEGAELYVRKLELRPLPAKLP